MSFAVRRVRAEDWRRVRDFRLEALQDPDAAIAFLEAHAVAADRPDVFWQERARGAAAGAIAAQFVAEEGEEWFGSVTVLRRKAGETDHLGAVLADARADVVGVYVRPSARGRGIIDALLSAAADWVRSLGDEALTLDVHAGNGRAQAAYRRAGFAPTGRRFTSQIGDEVQMRMPLDGATAR